MAELLQLDKAAALVGKSEVTLRRLIKAGKLKSEKQKTKTGFVYLLDAKVLATYFKQEVPDEPAARPAASGVRVAVVDELGDHGSYWQKRAELYEDRFQGELSKHAQTREELGLWRGRAEHAQSMLLKLLPSGQGVEVRQMAGGTKRGVVGNEVQGWLVRASAVLLVLVLLGLGVLAYLHFAPY